MRVKSLDGANVTPSGKFVPMRVGILGAGGMGNVHARQYRKMPDVDLFFHDRSPDRSEAFASAFDATPKEDVESLIAAVDVVDICLPTDLHHDAGMKAIAAGRAVFVEKPISRDLQSAMQLADAAERAGVPLMPGQVVRFFPEFKTGREMVVKGAVGKPAAARTRRGGKAPTGSQGWFMDHARSGGILIDLAIHDFDWLRWTLGEVKSLYSRSVAAKTGSGPDYALTTLTFENGCVAHVESTWMDPNGFRASFEVAGSEGIVQFDTRDQPAIRIKTSANEEGGPDHLSVAETPLAPTDDPYYLELRAFLDAVSQRREPPVAAYDGVAALAIALAAIESATTDRVVTPQKI